MTVKYRDRLRFGGLALLATAIIALHLLVLAGDPIWYGGWSYGPRLATDLVPWFALLAILSLEAFRRDAGNLIIVPAGESKASRQNRVIAMAGCLMLTLGVLINSRGALSNKTKLWNAAPALDQRVWDWKDVQFLAGIGHRRHPARPSR